MRLPNNWSNTGQVAPDGAAIVLGAPPDDMRRTAAANVPYVEGLVSNGRLPHSASVRSVRADGNVMVLTTTLDDEASGHELWEALTQAIGCDDSFMRIRGRRVVLRDGSIVDTPGPGYVLCAGT